MKRFIKSVSRLAAVVLATLAAFLSLQIPAMKAQQTRNVPGSPSAREALDARRLPPPPPKFGGMINRNAGPSTPWSPPRIVPPKGAPNILLIMTDDAGFGAPSTFGGIIPTPNMDGIAKMGLRYNNFHSTALCSPTRTDHWKQPSLGGLRSDIGAVDRLSRL